MDGRTKGWMLGWGVILRMEDEGHHWRQGSVSDMGGGRSMKGWRLQQMKVIVKD